MHQRGNKIEEKLIKNALEDALNSNFNAWLKQFFLHNKLVFKV